MVFSLSSRCGEAAINYDDFARDEAIARNEVQHRLGHIVTCHATTKRSGAGTLAHQVFIFIAEHAFHPLPFHPSGRDSVHADFRAQVPCKGLGQIDNRSLACGIRQWLWTRAKADNTCGIDDGRIVSFTQERNSRSRYLKSATYIYCERAIPLG